MVGNSLPIFYISSYDNGEIVQHTKIFDRGLYTDIDDFKQKVVSSIDKYVLSIMYIEATKIYFSKKVTAYGVLGQVVNRLGDKISLCIPISEDLIPEDDIIIIQIFDSLIDNIFNVSNA